MASITLTVIVTGGIPPVQIQVQIFENGNDFCNYSSPQSFTHTFDGLNVGNTYDIYIGGFNPAGGSTTSSIVCPGFTLYPPDPSPVTYVGISYTAQFHIA